MYKIFFYETKRGESPILIYIESLRLSKDKSGKIKRDKINDYLQLLAQNGLAAGEPYIKHLDGEIWELRPIRDRILFAAWIDDSFILLHHFVKKTRVTPPREIEKAKRELAEIRSRTEKIVSERERG